MAVETDALAFAAGIERVLAQPALIRPVFQPIVDLRRGVVAGYEALARFGVEPLAPPDRWFAAARAHGVGDELEAAVLAVALEARHRLPRNRFLSVNADPNALATEPVERALAGVDDLGGVVVELTEHEQIGDQQLLGLALDRWRAKGARVAVDDAGAGYAGLTWLLELRPDLLKLDRALVADLDRDEAKRALVEVVGALAGRLDAWVIAEGIERLEELDVLVGLGVPLGQGWALGRPHADWQPCDAEAGDRIRAADDARSGHGLLPLTELRPTALGDDGAAELFAAQPPLDAVVVIDPATGRPRTLHLRDGAVADPLVANVTSSPQDVALRAVARPPGTRFTPVLCTDDAGRFVGVVPIERLVTWLAVASRP